MTRQSEDVKNVRFEKDNKLSISWFPIHIFFLSIRMFKKGFQGSIYVKDFCYGKEIFSFARSRRFYDSPYGPSCTPTQLCCDLKIQKCCTKIPMLEEILKAKATLIVEHFSSEKHRLATQLFYSNFDYNEEQKEHRRGAKCDGDYYMSLSHKKL